MPAAGGGALAPAMGRLAPGRGGAPASRELVVRALLALAGVLAVAGMGVATYLTVVHFADQPIVCSSIGDCEYVNSSTYAEVAGVPVATMGAVAYAVMLLLVVAALVRAAPMLVLAAWAVAVASFAFSMYLTYIELFVLDAICVWCVGSATIVTAMLVVLSAAVWLLRGALFGEADGDGDELDGEAS
jgi:uncharacterized membrane protein